MGVSKKTISEQESWMLENGYTEQDLDDMWEFCVLFGHPIIRNLSGAGKSWTDLNLMAVKTMESEYNKLLRKILENGDN